MHQKRAVKCDRAPATKPVLSDWLNKPQELRGSAHGISQVVFNIYIYIYRNQRGRNWRDVWGRNEITMALFAHKIHTCGITRRTQPQLCTDTSHATKAAACTQATATIYNTQTRKRTIPSNENNAACSALELFKFPVPALHHQVCTRRLRDYCR